MFDSLNRRYLPPYGCDWTVMPNFARLTEKTVTFDTAFVGSMPCMPARRELHTGRYNFLHRGWGPMEPFDDSVPQLLSENGVYTHLATDHYHYWEDGGCTYHTRYTSCDLIRGQEGDGFIGQVADPECPDNSPRGNRDSFGPAAARHSSWRKDWVNRRHTAGVEDQPQHKTMMTGLEFIKRNHNEDSWFLHIETFDPHEPYFTQQKYKDLYPHDYDGPHFDWPPYRGVEESPDVVQHCRYEAAALHSMCDDYLGRILDAMDELDMWDDTMLIVNTDHGFLMGEHDWWAKCHCPFYNEIAHMPLFVWDPRTGVKDVHRSSLVQTIDIPASILDFFGLDAPRDMLGVPLRQVIEHDTPVREAGLFGVFGGHMNVTDGRYVYMRAPADPERNGPLYQYTHMPTHMTDRFSVKEMRSMTAAPPFDFTKECPTMKIAAHGGQPYGTDNWMRNDIDKTFLFDLESDPRQASPITDPEIERRMIQLMVDVMKANDAPPEQYERLGLTERQDLE